MNATRLLALLLLLATKVEVCPFLVKRARRLFQSDIQKTLLKYTFSFVDSINPKKNVSKQKRKGKESKQQGRISSLLEFALFISDGDDLQIEPETMGYFMSDLSGDDKETQRTVFVDIEEQKQFVVTTLDIEVVDESSRAPPVQTQNTNISQRGDLGDIKALILRAKEEDPDWFENVFSESISNLVVKDGKNGRGGATEEEESFIADDKSINQADGDDIANSSQNAIDPPEQEQATPPFVSPGMAAAPSDTGPVTPVSPVSPPKPSSSSSSSVNQEGAVPIEDFEELLDLGYSIADIYLLKDTVIDMILQNEVQRPGLSELPQKWTKIGQGQGRVQGQGQGPPPPGVQARDRGKGRGKGRGRGPQVSSDRGPTAPAPAPASASASASTVDVDATSWSTGAGVGTGAGAGAGTKFDWKGELPYPPPDAYYNDDDDDDDGKGKAFGGDDYDDDDDDDDDEALGEFWPSSEEFKDMLLDESRMRIDMVGPWISPLVREETKWR